MLHSTPSPARPLTAIQTRTATPTSPSKAISACDDSAQPAESQVQGVVITEVTTFSTATEEPAVAISHERVTVLCAVLLCMLRWSMSTLTCIYHKGGAVTNTWYNVLGSKRIAAATGVRRAAVYSSSVFTAWGLTITATAAPCVNRASYRLALAFTAATQLNNSARGAAAAWLHAIAIICAGLHAGLFQTARKVWCFSFHAKADWCLILSIA